MWPLRETISISGLSGRRHPRRRRTYAGRRQANLTKNVQRVRRHCQRRRPHFGWRSVLAPTCTCSAPSSLAPTREARFGNSFPQRLHMLLVSHNGQIWQKIRRERTTWVGPAFSCHTTWPRALSYFSQRSVTQEYNKQLNPYFYIMLHNKFNKKRSKRS